MASDEGEDERRDERRDERSLLRRVICAQRASRSQRVFFAYVRWETRQKYAYAWYLATSLRNALALTMAFICRGCGRPNISQRALDCHLGKRENALCQKVYVEGAAGV